MITVNSAEASQESCLAGLGIIQAPRSGVLANIAAGELVEVLPQYGCEPLQVSLVHAHGRQVPQAVRVVMSWMEQLLKPQLD